MPDSFIADATENDSFIPEGAADLSAPAPVERIPGMDRLGPLPGISRPAVDVQPQSLFTPPRRYAPAAPAPKPAIPGASSEEPTIGPAAPSALNVVRHGALGRLFGEPQATAEAFTQPGQTPNLLRFESAVPTSAPTVVKAASEFASGLTSPENVGIMAATSGLGALESQVGKAGLSKLISMGFSSQMLHDAGSQYGDAIKAWQSGDNEAAVRLAKHGTLATAMGILGLKHVIAPEGVAPIATASMREPFKSEAPPRYVTEPRDTVAQQLTGKSFNELQPEDRTVVNDLVSQGDRATKPLNRAQRRALSYPPSTSASDLSAPTPVEGAPAPAGDLGTPAPVERPAAPKPSRVDRVTEFTPNPPTAAIPTTPESPATYQAQVDQLNTGQRVIHEESFLRWLEWMDEQ